MGRATKSRQKFYLTLEGKTKYQAELANLQITLRQLNRQIKTMRHFNEVKDNGDWETAQREYEYLTGRIGQLQEIVEHAELMRPLLRQQVELGSTVRVRNGHGELVYTIVDPIEADPESGKISYASPVGGALLGKKINDVARVVLPNGAFAYQVLAIQ
ncbi:GreA/GreB family elongation factor [Candidatus Microgenomates bacterium]|nr:GreA/GreB family elongation factor [Candidatus Microgenomates bacterium]